jgi:hypothetical protein
VLFGGYGAGLVIAGIFSTDPFGFPPGAPAGMPLTILIAAGVAFVMTGIVSSWWVAAWRRG